MSDTDTQAALALDTLGKPTARLTGGYQSAQTPPKWSYATRIQPDKIPAGRADGSDLPVYRLFFPAQRNVDGTMTKNEWWEFPRHLTILQERVDTEFPNGFQGKYRADISWRVRWGKSGNSLYIKEILSVEGPMQAPTELDQHLNANGDQQVNQPNHETDPRKCLYAMPAHVKRVHELDDATTGRVVRTIFGMALPDALAKFGVAKCWTMITDFDTANKPGEVAARFAPPAEPPAPAAPETGAQAAQATPPATTPPVKAQNATNRPVETKNGQSKDNPVTSEPDAKEYIRAKYTKKLQGGKEYLEVQGRVLLFRLDHPDWSLETDVIAMTDDAAIFKCTIRNADGRIISTGHGRATAAGTKNLGSRFIEKAETAAIGRALSLASYGTDDTLEDSDYLADSPVAKAA